MDVPRRNFASGQIVMRQGDTGDTAWLIESGTLEILLTSKAGTKRINTVGRNAIIGEMALIDGGPRTASVRCLSPVVCVEISRAAFVKMIRQSNKLAMFLLNTLVAEIRAGYQLANTAHAVPQDLRELRSTTGHDRVLERHLYAEGRVLFNEGDLPATAYLIQSGLIRVHKGDEVLAELGPGRILGELALLGDKPRAASATVIKGAVCEVISRGEFQHAIDSMPPVLRALTRMYVEQVSRKS